MGVLAPWRAAADSTAVTPGVPSGVLERLESGNAGLLDLSARFVHTKEVPLFDEKITSKGILYYGKPDRLILQYTEPDSSRVIITGGSIWLYYPGLGQAHRYEVDPEIALPGVFLAFGGSGKGVEKRFAVKNLPPGREEGFITDKVVLTPLPGTELAEDVESIELVIRREANLPVRCEFREISGDHTVFEFSDYKRNIGLPPGFFEFVPPEGTEVFDVEGESW